MARTQEELNKEYTQQCTVLGDMRYKQALLESEINAVVERMKSLNREANEAINAAKENTDEKDNTGVSTSAD